MVDADQPEVRSGCGGGRIWEAKIQPSCMAPSGEKGAHGVSRLAELRANRRGVGLSDLLVCTLKGSCLAQDLAVPRCARYFLLDSTRVNIC